MREAAPKAIQELAGHRGLTTSLRYMHFSPAAEGQRQAARGTGFGDILETGGSASRKREWIETVKW
jgi:hypothetical protein